jgi:hypothetical protein
MLDSLQFDSRCICVSIRKSPRESNAKLCRWWQLYEERQRMIQCESFDRNSMCQGIHIKIILQRYDLWRCLSFIRIVLESTADWHRSVTWDRYSTTRRCIGWQIIRTFSKNSPSVAGSFFLRFSWFERPSKCASVLKSNAIHRMRIETYFFSENYDCKRVIHWKPMTKRPSSRFILSSKSFVECSLSVELSNWRHHEASWTKINLWETFWCWMREIMKEMIEYWI